MRIMVKEKIKLEVLEHVITKNLWEYYVCHAETNSGRIRLCLVMGFETEIGDVDMEELKPHIASRTSNLKDVAPATGWKWED